MHPALEAICYSVGTVCFFIAVFRHKMSPTSLDFLALGVLLYTLPFVVEKLVPFV